MLWMNGRSREYSSAPWSLDVVAGVTVTPDRRREVRAVAMLSMDEVTRQVSRGTTGKLEEWESGALVWTSVAWPQPP
jgi:hypothetical protein